MNIPKAVRDLVNTTLANLIKLFSLCVLSACIFLFT